MITHEPTYLRTFVNPTVLTVSQVAELPSSLPGRSRVLSFTGPSRVRQSIKPYRVHHFLNCGLVVRFRFLPTPSLDDVVNFSYGQTKGPDQRPRAVGADEHLQLPEPDPGLHRLLAGVRIPRVLSECDLLANGIDLSPLEHVSPIEWDNIVLYGQYLDQKVVRQRRHAKRVVLSV